MAVMVEKRYGMLRIITILLKVAAVLVLAFGLIGGVGAMAGSAGVKHAAGPEMDEPTQQAISVGMLSGGFGVIVMGILGAIGLWAWAELIKLLIAVEENTRKTHVLVERERA